ncbi:unnamed protein product [Coffea canephora]|uniref:DH200=94 genomic scaffold, scaffold_567 n=1 Tax=Coffea canephora TaxID=49390 RepID=A0A068VFW5_COFCA|nr:unnamed protein product [Coffea canephora]
MAILLAVFFSLVIDMCLFLFRKFLVLLLSRILVPYALRNPGLAGAKELSRDSSGCWMEDYSRNSACKLGNCYQYFG